MKIKVVFLNDCEINCYTKDAAKHLSDQGVVSINCSVYEDDNGLEEYKYDLLNKLSKIYNKYKDDFDHVMILREYTSILNFSILLESLKELNFDEKIFAFRIVDVKGIMLKYGPRVPFIDDSIIIMNLKMAKEKNYFDRKLINGCHFYKYAGNHALLQSLIEYSLSKDEFINFENPKNIKDEYGKNTKNSFPFPFSLSEDTFIINADLNYDIKYNEILKALVTKNKIEESIYFQQHGLASCIKKLLDLINSKLRKIENKEFKKSYDEK